MGYVIGTDSRQMTLGVWSIEDEVPQDSPARFIEVFVDSLDLETMGFEHTVPAPTGRPPSLTFTDPESAMMPAKEGGIKACYNVQTAVDAKSHIYQPGSAGSSEAMMPR